MSCDKISFVSLGASKNEVDSFFIDIFVILVCFVFCAYPYFTNHSLINTTKRMSIPVANPSQVAICISFTQSFCEIVNAVGRLSKSCRDTSHANVFVADDVHKQPIESDKSVFLTALGRVRFYDTEKAVEAALNALDSKLESLLMNSDDKSVFHERLLSVEDTNKLIAFAEKQGVSIDDMNRAFDAVCDELIGHAKRKQASAKEKGENSNKQHQQRAVKAIPNGGGGGARVIVSKNSKVKKQQRNDKRKFKDTIIRKAFF